MNLGLWLVTALSLILLKAEPAYGTEQRLSPNIAVSITPFYALVAAIIKNTDTPNPKLLVKPGASPHQYALKPSDLQALDAADIVIWAGPEYETFLTRPLENLKQQLPHKQIITLQSTPHLIRLPVREGGRWEAHQHDAHDHSHNHSNLIDMHFWLDPENAILMVDTIVQTLTRLDPRQAAQ